MVHGDDEATSLSRKRANPSEAFDFALAIERSEVRADLDGQIVGNEVALPPIFFSGIARLQAALPQRKKNGVFQAVTNVRCEIWRVRPPQAVVDGIVFVGRDDTLLERRAELRDGEKQVGVLEEFNVAGGLSDGWNGERFRESLERHGLASVREEKQCEVHHMPRFTEVVTLRNVPLHDVTQQLLENLGIAFVKISRKPTVIEV